jgi:hypothetical protein
VAGLHQGGGGSVDSIEVGRWPVLGMGQTGAAEDRESVERLGGSAYAREKAEEQEFCSVAPGSGREQKEGEWGPTRAFEEEKGGGPVG